MNVNPNVTRVQPEYQSIDFTGAPVLQAIGNDTTPGDASVPENDLAVTPDQTLHDTAFSDPAFYLTNTKPSGDSEEKR